MTYPFLFNKIKRVTKCGYSMQQAGELAKNTSILMNVSEFEDVNQATETLISALQAFKKKGQDVGTFSMEIIDKYNVRWLMIWNKMLFDNINSHYVITLDDVIIGFLTISVARDNDLKDSFYELVGLYLNPEYVAKGYGKQAMDWIKKEIKSRGYDKISLWVLEENNRARRFYEKAGFVSDGEAKPSGLADTQEVRYICKCNS